MSALSRKIASKRAEREKELAISRQHTPGSQLHVHRLRCVAFHPHAIHCIAYQQFPRPSDADEDKDEVGEGSGHDAGNSMKNATKRGAAAREGAAAGDDADENDAVDRLWRERDARSRKRDTRFAVARYRFIWLGDVWGVGSLFHRMHHTAPP